MNTVSKLVFKYERLCDFDAAIQASKKKRKGAA